MTWCAIFVAVLAALAERDSMVNLERILANSLSTNSASTLVYAIQFCPTYLLDKDT